MGIRETLNQNPKRATQLTVAVMTVAVGVIAFQMFGPGGQRSVGPFKSFYTIDGGTTVFLDDASKTVPFTSQGRTAYRAFVFTCDQGKTRFVAYLERLVPDKSTNTPPATHPTGSAKPIADTDYSSLISEVRRPSDPDTAWIPVTDFNRVQHVLSVTCQDGSAATPITP